MGVNMSCLRFENIGKDKVKRIYVVHVPKVTQLLKIYCSVLVPYRIKPNSGNGRSSSATSGGTSSILLFTSMNAGIIISVLYFGVHVFFTALWHLGSVISVLEPVYGLAAMRKAYELLKGKTKMAMGLVFVYLLLCGLIGVVFGAVVVHGGGKYGTFTRTLVGGLLVGVLVMVNLVGLLVQSVFYYVCKSYHHQTIDKTALYDHLGGYLGDYVPLKSNIQLENLDI
ncbi:PREDICTED: uncharacterized protein LOC104759583 [Camelina sativa]|uniref:Uncharacterized protein LOC104759583 n=1 Tax=Camelina sativa TaxID=90675 RepID=A0ABM0X506_CAMSA|nr:PREDICTED: uncharacterized protein LOC104759583 [Camelina sativa]